MQKRILVAYASKYGATEAIAEKIGEALIADGLSVDVLSADTVTDLETYSAVILGSAVYAGMWRKEAIDFLEAYEAALSVRPTWFFSSGPTGEGDDPVEMMKGWQFPTAQQPIADRIQPRGIALFHGDIDMSKLNFGERLIIRAMRAPTGDFRDWESIEAWAANVAQTLKLEMA